MNRDAGLQAERTAQAWERTALVAVVDALLVLRAGVHDRAAGWPSWALLLATVTCAIVAIAALRRHALRRVPQAIGPAVAVVMVAAVVGIALAGAVIQVVPN